MNSHGGKRPGAGRKTAGEESGNSESIVAFNEARARKETALADIREIEAMKLRGELLDRRAVAEANDKILAIMQAHLLELPSRMAAELVGIDDVRETEMAMRRMTDETLLALAADLRTLGSRVADFAADAILEEMDKDGA